jgi:hypothetical protein
MPFVTLGSEEHQATKRPDTSLHPTKGCRSQSSSQEFEVTLSSHGLGNVRIADQNNDYRHSER